MDDDEFFLGGGGGTVDHIQECYVASRGSNQSLFHFLSILEITCMLANVVN